MLAEMSTLLFTMESIVYRTAVDYDNKLDVSKNSAIVKLYCSESLDKIADFAVQISWRKWVIPEKLPIERYYRDSRIKQNFLKEHRKFKKEIIAREVLKKKRLDVKIISKGDYL